MIISCLFFVNKTFSWLKQIMSDQAQQQPLATNAPDSQDVQQK